MDDNLEYAPPNVKLIRNDLYRNELYKSSLINLVTTFIHPNGIIEIDVQENTEDHVFNKNMSEAFNHNFNWFKSKKLIEDVSITGIKDNILDGPGSSRFSTMSPNLSLIVKSILDKSAATPQINTLGIGKFEKVSNYFRFMKYLDGGQHYPHYDSDFNINNEYATKLSLVIYHNHSWDGELFFCNDERILNNKDLTTDWDKQAVDSEIYLKIKPATMKLVIFPHTLCHGVLPFTGQERNIIRGDLIFKV